MLGLVVSKQASAPAYLAENVMESLRGPAAVTALSSMIMFWTGIRVGYARMKYKVPPPETTGHPVFSQYFRAQQNMMESLVQFLPVLWTFAVFVSAPMATILGFIYLVGRVIYTLGYCSDNVGNRFPGFLMATLTTLTMAFGSLFALVPPLLK